MPSLISSLSGAIELLALGAFAFEPQNLFVEESYSSKGTRCLRYGSATVAPPSTDCFAILPSSPTPPFGKFSAKNSLPLQGV